MKDISSSTSRGGEDFLPSTASLATRISDYLTLKDKNNPNESGSSPRQPQTAKLSSDKGLKKVLQRYRSRGKGHE